MVDYNDETKGSKHDQREICMDNVNEWYGVSIYKLKWGSDGWEKYLIGDIGCWRQV